MLNCHQPQPRARHSSAASRLPTIIQGGMGVGVSSWRLARRVAELGEFGLVSGTAIDALVVRELQQGDPNERLRVLSAYPDQEIVEWLAARFYVPGGIGEADSFKLLPIHRFKPTIRSQRILSACAFSEVALAKEGHDGLVGINLMAKLKRYTLAVGYGAMLAGVDGVFIGAGIPLEEAVALQRLADGQPAELRLEVASGPATDSAKSFHYRLDPADLVRAPEPLPMPGFYPIVSSDLLVGILHKKLPTGSVAGWIIEGASAGGHTAPPRNKRYDEAHNPVYDERDRADLDRIAELGIPFYLAGGYASPEKLRDALDAGAAGIQVGSLFSLADESGYPRSDKEALIRGIHAGELSIRTDGRVSSTGFPFKVVELPGSLGDPELARDRVRICDLGYLQQAYVDENGQVRGRCPAEPQADYVRKGGDEEDTHRRACLCNALMANIGLGQRQKWGPEGTLFTAGEALTDLPLGSVEHPRYSAEEVIRYLRGEGASAERNREDLRRDAPHVNAGSAACALGVPPHG